MEECKWTIDKSWESIVHKAPCSKETLKPISKWEYCPYCGKRLTVERPNA